MYVLGINAYSHDTGAALVTDRSGELEIVAIAEARLNRRNHSWTYPLLAIRYCLDHFGLDSLDDVDLVCFDRFIEQWPEPASAIGKEQAESGADRFGSDARWHYLVEQTIAIPPEKRLMVSHVDAHAASAYYPSGFDDAAIVSLEWGVGIFRGHGVRLEVIDKYGYLGPVVANGVVVEPLGQDPRNISCLWDAIGLGMGFDMFAGGKVMALAAYGGRFPRKDYLSLRNSRSQTRNFVISHDHNILKVEAAAQSARLGVSGAIEPMSELWVNIAREAQETLQEEMLHLASLAKQKTGARNLCLTGGVALSCVTNRHIYDNAGYDDIFIQPAASDEGIALGAAFLGYYAARGGTARTHMDTAYLGVPNDRGTLEAVLRRHGLGFRAADNREVARLLSQGNIIARVAGGSEFGPRALGNRSILADPRDPGMRDRINRDIKHRELFRPFAPSCHEDKRERYFDLPMTSPFMIMACMVKPEMREHLPAVVHVDGSSRVQTVSPAQNPDYWDLLNEFGALTGIYVLLNTSFNDRGEPIAETYEDAIVSFCSCGLDYLYVDGLLVQPPPESAALGSHLAASLEKDRADEYAAAVTALCDKAAFGRMLAEFERHDARRAISNTTHDEKRSAQIRV